MKLKERINSTLLIIIGWLIVFPLSLFFRRKKGLFVTIGRTGNGFVDNTKYFHLYLLQNHDNKKVFYISDTKNIDKTIPNYVKHPSLKSILILLKAEYVIIDYSLWFVNFKYHLSVKAKKIQLWHGIGSKKIELATDTFTKSKFKSIKILYGILRGQLSKYLLISSTSDYYTQNLYKDAFRYKEIKPLGQPRNDVLFREPSDYDLIGTDRAIINKIRKEKKNNGTKIILYTPTYRKYLNINIINLNKLNSFAKKNNFIFVIKHHVLTKNINFTNMENVLLYNKSKDIYPLMAISDLMITDYSSIYLDYIILNKPIIFYIPDYNDYKNFDTSLRDDFMKITPGEKCRKQEELQNTITEELINLKDRYKTKREEIANLSYKYIDGFSSERIYKYIYSK